MVTGDLEPGATVGEYQIERAIGEGSFGKVYAAVHPMIGKRAAIKVLGFEHAANPQFVSRFLEEARAVNKIRHRNIIDIFAFGQLDDGRHYFVMELLEGKPMGDWLATRGPIPLSEALPILRKVARALEAAHKQGIAHRGLKPDNVFLTFDEDGTVFPVLLDFGIAKLMGDSPMGHKTQTGTPMGTPLYMSPEQCRGGTMDHHTDIYSFGVVVFEMLTGRRPFDSGNVMEILMAHLSQVPPTMSSVNPALPAALDPPIARMLEKQPEKRPPSITVAIEALITAARSIGVAVPSSRHSSASDPAVSSSLQAFGGTAPMPFGQPPGMQAAMQTVPEAPAGNTHDPRPAIAHQQPTAQSPVYHPPPPPQLAGVAMSHVDSSLKPVDAPIPRPPPTRRKQGGNIWLVLGAIVAVVVVLTGGLFATGILTIEPSSSTETSDDRDDDDVPSTDKKKKKPAPAEPAGHTFGAIAPAPGTVCTTTETTRFTFTVVQGAKKVNVSSSVNQDTTLTVVTSQDDSVDRVDVTFDKSERLESVDHATPTKKNEPPHGNTYEVERQDSSILVRKKAGALDNEERKQVERHVAGLLGKNLFASTLTGKPITIGQTLDLPFVTAMHLMRETERNKFPKLTSSITLRKLTDVDGEQVGVFDIALSFQYDDDDGTTIASDLTGTVNIQVSSGRVVSLDTVGPLNMSHPKYTYEPGTFSYSFTTTYR